MAWWENDPIVSPGGGGTATQAGGDWFQGDEVVTGPEADALLSRGADQSPYRTPGEMLKTRVQHWKRTYAKGDPGDAALMFGEVLRRTPFIGAIPKVKEASAAVAAAERLKSGEFTDADLDALGKYLGRGEAEGEQGFSEKVWNTVLEIPGFAVEFAATGGAGKVVKEGVEKVTEKLIGETVKRGVGKAITKTAATAAGIAARTAANVPLVAKQTAERMGPGFSQLVDENGQFVAYDPTDGGRSFLEALPTGFLDAMIETGSEMSGGAVGQGLSKLGSPVRNVLAKLPMADRVKGIKDAIAARWLSVGTGRSVDGLRKTLEEVGWHGVVNEVLEERVGEVARLATGLQLPSQAVIGQLATGDWKPAVEQLQVEGLAFAIPGLAATAGQAIAQRADRLATLKEVTAKGYVSAEDGQTAGIEGETRKERMAAAAKEITQLEQELRNASQIPEDQGVPEETGQVGPGREADRGGDVRGAGQGQVQPEPAGEVAPARPEVRIAPEASTTPQEAAPTEQAPEPAAALETQPEAVGEATREAEAAVAEQQQILAKAGVKLTKNTKGWSVTGIPQEIADGLQADYQGKRTGRGYFFRSDPTEGLVDAAKEIAEEAEQTAAATASGLVRTRIGTYTPEAAEFFEQERTERLNLAKEDLSRRNSAIAELLSQFVPKGRRDQFKLSLLRASEKSDPSTVKAFDKMVAYAQNHPELGLPQTESELFDLLTGEAFTKDDAALLEAIDDQLADELAAELSDASFDFGANVEVEAEPKEPTNLLGEVEQPKAKREEFESLGGKHGTLFAKKGLPGQGNLFADAGVPEDMAAQRGVSGEASKPTGRPDVVPQPGSASGAMLQPVQMPELYQIAKELMEGKGPGVKKLHGAAGRFKGQESIGPLAILIDPKTAESEQALGQTLAHEIGHLIDFLPENTLKRGNLLGRLQSLRDFLQSTMPPLSKKDQSKLRRRARKEAGEEADKEQAEAIYQRILKDRGLLANSGIRQELLDLTKWWSGDYAGGKDSYVKYRESSRELYAEALSVFLNSPGDLETRAPQFYRALLDHLDAKPDVLAAYSTLQQILNGTGQELAESRTQTLQDMFGRAEEHINNLRVAQEQQKKSAWSGIVDFLGQYFLTSAQPVFAKLGRKPIKRGEAAEAEAARFALDELFTIDAPNHTLLRKVDETVYQPLIEVMQSRGLDRKAAEAEANFTLGEYLYHWRVANERDAVANPAGFTVTPSAAQLNAIQTRIGDDAYAKLQAHAQRFHDLVYGVAEEAAKEGVYNRQTFDELITPNKDNYAAFRVTHHIDSPDMIATGVIKQIGTFSDIQNPFHATVLKAVRLNRLIELNRAKNRTRVFLEQNFPGDILPVEMAFVAEDRPQVPKKRPAQGKEHLIELVDGKPTYFEVPAEIAKSFQLHDIGGLGRIAALVNSAAYKVFHPFFVTYNPGFVLANPFRDLRRTWVNLGSTDGITLGKLLSEWVKALPVAVRRQKGIEDAVIREMIDSHALDIPYTDVAAEGIDSQIDALFQKYGLREKQKPALQKIPFIGKLLELIEHAGAITETASKVAGWRVLEEQGVPVQERSYRVRKYVGTPDYKQRGLATALTNSMLMYSRVRWNALQADIGLATNRETAAGWWWRQLVNVVLPTSIAKAGAYGAFGLALRAMFGVDDDDDESLAGKTATWTDETGKRIAKYFLTDYDVLPLGVNRDGKAVFITVPRDDLGKFIARTWWHLTDMAQLATGHELREGEGARNVLGNQFTDMQQEILPSFSPPIEITSKWLQYGAGINPIDSFYNQQIVPRKEWTAGGWQADSKMIAWTLDEFGAPGALIHYPLSPLLGESFETGTSGGVEAVMKTAGTMTGLKRFLRVSDSGLTSGQWARLENADQEDAAFRLSLPKSAQDATTRRYFLMRRESLGDELSKSEKNEMHDLNLFYNAAYLPLRKLIQESGDGKELMADMQRAADSPNGLWSGAPASIKSEVESYKQGVVLAAVASPPDRKRYKSAAEYEERLTKHKAALTISRARLKHFGPSLEEAQALLRDHQREQYGKPTPGYIQKYKALRKLYAAAE